MHESKEGKGVWKQCVWRSSIVTFEVVALSVILMLTISVHWIHVSSCLFWGWSQVKPAQPNAHNIIAHSHIALNAHFIALCIVTAHCKHKRPDHDLDVIINSVEYIIVYRMIIKIENKNNNYLLYMNLKSTSHSW